MTKNEAHAIKAHSDGGTYEVLALAETRNRWAIAITRWTTYRNTVVFEVKRVSPENVTLRLAHFDTEKEARNYGNEMWKADRS